MRKNIVAGNWKMNKTLQEGVALATELKEMLVQFQTALFLTFQVFSQN